MRSLRKDRIITEQPNIGNSDEEDSDSDETDPEMLDVEIAQLLNSNIEDEKFYGYHSDSDETDPEMLDVEIAQLLNSDIDEKFDRYLEEE